MWVLTTDLVVTKLSAMNVKSAIAAHHGQRSPRLSAEERREAIVAAALGEFALKGLAGASTDLIAARAGVSQPYVFQLFGTKRDLFLAVVRHAFQRTSIAFEDAAQRYTNGESMGCDSILGAMGGAYMQLLSDRTLLLIQLQAYAACGEPEVRIAVREEFAKLHRGVAQTTGASGAEIHQFFAEGMLLNVGAAVQLEGESLTWTLDKLGGTA